MLEFARVICLYSNLYTYKASECKHAIIRLHCATSKSSVWNMGYVAHGGAFEHPRIYRTNIHVHLNAKSQSHQLFTQATARYVAWF